MIWSPLAATCTSMMYLCSACEPLEVTALSKCFKDTHLSLKTFYGDYHHNIWNIQTQPAAITCYQCVHVEYVWMSALLLCFLLHHRHARSHRTAALLEDYGYNMLSEMQFAGSIRETCMRHVQLMITHSLHSQQSLLSQISNAQKMKWIKSRSRQRAKAAIDPSSFTYSPFLLYVLMSLQQR